MSEVQRFWSHEASNIRCVREADFDRVTAERDALVQNLRFAEEGYISFAEECDKLQQRLTAADERADVLEGLLNLAQGQIGDANLSREIDAALKPEGGGKPSTCTWSEGGFSWQTGCGKEWQFTDGGLPAENGMRFCHSCGKALAVEPAEGGGDGL